MARAKTTFDTFNAIAEPQRRALIESMVGRKMTVNEIVEAQGWNQPKVSKHLSVLKQVGLVTEQRVGRCRVYEVNPQPLQGIQHWLSQFERYWQGNLDSLDDYLQDLQNKEKEHKND